MTKYYIKFKSKTYGEYRLHTFSSLPGCTVNRPDLTPLGPVGLPFTERDVKNDHDNSLHNGLEIKKGCIYIYIRPLST